MKNAKHSTHPKTQSKINGTVGGWVQHHDWNLEVMGNLRITQESVKAEELVLGFQGMGISCSMQV